MTSFGPLKQSVFLLPFVTNDKRKWPPRHERKRDPEKEVETIRLQKVCKKVSDEQLIPNFHFWRIKPHRLTNNKPM